MLYFPDATLSLRQVVFFTFFKMSDFWSNCLEQLRRDFTPELFHTWFSELQADDSALLTENVLKIFVTSSAKLSALKSAYASKLTEVVSNVAGQPVTLSWAVAKPVSQTTSETVENKENSNFVKENPVKVETATQNKTGLLPQLTFETIVQGKANQMAYAAAMQVANNMGKPIYNPLIIYGGVGLGKTHLMHAIGHQFLKSNPTKKLLCISAQQYLEEYTGVMRLLNNDSNRYFQEIHQFEKRYQDLDMLLIDDIQGFSSRRGTQASFFQVFEHMVPHGKQIVMTSDTYPRDLKDLQERLLSRLTQGITVEVEPPELEMRVQILLSKAERSGLSMPTEVAEEIAKHLRSNVRELEGAVQQILAYTNFHKVPVTLQTITEALKDIFNSTSVPVTVESIQQAVCDHFKIKQVDLLSKKRIAAVSHARQVAMYLAKELTQKSLPEIGAMFGGKDHTTVLYACRKVSSSLSTDSALRNDIHLLEQRIKS